MTEVRRITSEDAATLKDIRLAALLDFPEAFESTYEQERLRSDAEWAQRAARDSDGDGSAVFLACDANRGIGMTGAYTPDGRPNERHIWGMWVALHARRRRVGWAMLEHVTVWARSVGAERVTLWVVESNAAAMALYRAYGFTPTGERKPLVSNPASTEVKLGLLLPDAD